MRVAIFVLGETSVNLGVVGLEIADSGTMAMEERDD